MADNVIPMPTTLPPGMPTQPGQPMQIMLPQPLQDIMQQWPEIKQRLKAVEEKPVATVSPNLKLVAITGFVVGAACMAILTFLWHYGAVILKLWS